MDLFSIAIRFGLLLPAIVLHEVAHGYAAYLLGDTTAKDKGRLSLNPIRHIDPFGTILLPILLVATLGVGFGYAKPVPINPWRFANYRQGMFLTGIAGPVTNLALAAVSGAAFRVIVAMQGEPGFGATLLWLFAYMNLMLMFFNLIPIPPLDGSRVLPLFLTDNGMKIYDNVERYGFIILFALLWFSPQLFGFSVIGWYFSWTVDPLMSLFAGTL